MSNVLTVSNEDIVNHIKLSFQVPDVVEAIATRKIIANAAFEAGIKVGEEEVQQAADRMRLVKRLVKADETWAWLVKHHLSLDDFEKLTYTNLLAAKLAFHLFANQVEPFFYENQLNYIAAVTNEVIFDNEDLAFELFYEVEEGEITFSEIASQYIENPELRRIGGYQGVKYRKDFTPEIAPAVFAATPPQILKPITTSAGTHLIWVQEIIQPQLDEQLRQQIIKQLFDGWLKGRLEQVEIVTELNLEAVGV